MAGNNNSGRKAKPDAIHRLNGNPSKKSLGAVSDLHSGGVDWKSVNTMPECPEFLDEVGKQKWEQLAGDLHALGFLTRLDRDALAVYCQNYSLWAKASKEIKRNGEIVFSPNGYPQVSPWVSVRKGAVSEMLSIQNSFGLSPSARSKSLPTANMATQGMLFNDEMSDALKRVQGNMVDYGLH